MVRLSTVFCPPKTNWHRNRNSAITKTGHKQKKICYHMWPGTSRWFGPSLAWHLPATHKTASHAWQKKRRTHRSVMLLQMHSLIKLCGFILKEGEVLKAKRLSLLAGRVRRKLSCVCPVVAQSRCPNPFPQHFLLSTKHQRLKTFMIKKKKKV